MVSNWTKNYYDPQYLTHHNYVGFSTTFCSQCNLPSCIWERQYRTVLHPPWCEPAWISSLSRFVLKGSKQFMKACNLSIYHHHFRVMKLELKCFYFYILSLSEYIQELLSRTCELCESDTEQSSTTVPGLFVVTVNVRTRQKQSRDTRADFRTYKTVYTLL